MKRSDNKTAHGTAALYCRLSRDDNMDSESNSIQTKQDSVLHQRDGTDNEHRPRPADERNRAMSEALGEDVYHYHLHVVYILSLIHIYGLTACFGMYPVIFHEKSFSIAHLLPV